MTWPDTWQLLRDLWTSWEPNDVQAREWHDALKQYPYATIEKVARMVYREHRVRPSLGVFLAEVRAERQLEISPCPVKTATVNLDPNDSQYNVVDWAKMYFPGLSRQPKDVAEQKIKYAIKDYEERGQELDSHERLKLAREWGWWK